MLVADSKKKLERLVKKSGRIYRRRKSKVNVANSKMPEIVLSVVEYHVGGGGSF